MANLKDINKYYADGFDCDTQVSWDSDELSIYINDRTSVCIQNITKDEAIVFAERLLSKWDFSYMLEFDNVDKAYDFINQ